MKKLLLLVLVGLCAVNQTNAMLYRKTHTQELVPVFQPEVKIDDEKWCPQVTQASLLPQLEELEGPTRKEKIKAWCDEFKKNSKKPAMWQKPEEVKTRDIEKVEPCLFEKDKAQNIIHALTIDITNLNRQKNFLAKSDLEFLHRIEDIQKNEWDKWQINGQHIAGTQVTYKEEEKPVEYSLHKFSDYSMRSSNDYRYFTIFNKSPYYKKTKEGYNSTLTHELENSAYHHALQSLQLTEEALKRDLHNQSYIQRLWNYARRQNSHQALAHIKNEIALFKGEIEMFEDQGEVVSPEKIVNISSIDDVDTAKDGKHFLKKKYLKPSLTHRQVFTRSSMPRTFFEGVKTARE